MHTTLPASAASAALAIALTAGGAAAQPLVPPAVAQPAATAAPLPAPAAHSSAELVPLEYGNPFDARRQMWPDRIPPPPPPAPPPAPPPVTEQDLQLYGVVIVGGNKRATVRVGPRFAALADGGRPFVTLVEGQQLGEYSVSRIEPTHVVLVAQGGQQQVYFTKKADRSAGAIASAATPPPVQAATEVHAPVAAGADGAVAGTAPPGQAGAARPATPAAAALGQAAAAAAAANGAAQPAQQAANPMGNSLADALAAARAKAAQNPGAGGAPAPIFGNPFNQKP